MSNAFGDSFGRSLRLLLAKWPLLFYPLLGSLIGFIIMVPVITIIVLLFFMPIVNELPNLTEQQVVGVVFDYLASPGATGAVIFVAFILISVAVQAFVLSAQGGVFKRAISGLSIGIGEYFKNGTKWWFKVFTTQLVAVAIFGVPAILFFKFGILKNIQMLMQNPNFLEPSFIISMVIFGLIMIVVSLVYVLITYFWIPAIIIGERDVLGSFKKSVGLGFKNILYLIAVAVIMLAANVTVSFFSNLNPDSMLVIVAATMLNYLINVYFSFFKFVWYDGLNIKDNNGLFPSEDTHHHEDSEPIPPGTVL